MHTQYPVYIVHAYKRQYWLSNKFNFKLEAMKLFHLLPSLFLLQLEVPQLSHLEVLSQLLSVSLDYWLVCLKHQMCQLQPCKRNIIYCIQPNYCTVRLGFSKLLGKLVVKYVSTYTKGTLLNSSMETYLMMLLRCFCVFLFF